jgi:hypothetical protein
MRLLATPEQKKTIEKLGAELGTRFFDLDNLGRKEASAKITYLINLKRKRGRWHEA